MKSLRRLALALALLLAAGAASAEVQKRTLLASDGTLYQVATGLAWELSAPGLATDDFAVVWSAFAQDGAQAGGLIPGAASSSPKTSLDLTVDEPTGTLVVLWREENSLVNKIRLAFWKAGKWTIADLLPSVGFPHAYNPQMLLTHQTVHAKDEAGADVYTNRSVLSILWWEEAGYSQARYASFFLDEPIDPSRVAIYDLPELVNDQGPTSLQDLPRGAYAYPSLQAEGPGGAILASFAALFSNRHYVVRISYPTELGKPSADNSTWLRRRIPVVGIASTGPIATMPAFGASSVRTVVGSSYKPTLHWRDDAGLHYIRFDGAAWSVVRSIALSDEMTYEKAVALVEGMAKRN
ncbi:MAG: hypothetical protein ACRD3M_00710 [Thermoanaerobaculia bacterium]